MPALLVEHFEKVDEDVRYLLEGAPSEPGGRFAPRDASEERFRQLHLDRLGHDDHAAALQRLVDDVLPEEEEWELESEDEAVSDDDEDDEDDEDEEDVDGSRCADLFSRVGGALVILFVAAGLCVQYYVLAFPEPLED